VTSEATTEQGGGGERRALVHETVLRLSSLIQSMRMYPPGHPRIDAASSACVQTLEKVFARRPALLLLVHFDKLLSDGGVLSDTDPIAKSFVPELRKRRIRMVLISSGVSPEGVGGLARIIAMKPEELESLGGARQALADAGAATVEILEFRYSMDGRETGVETQDPAKAVRNARQLLAYGAAFEDLLKEADLPPSDIPVLRRALMDQSVLERSLILDGSLSAEELRRGSRGLSITVMQALVTLMKQSRVRFGIVGHQAVGDTIKWVMDAAAHTVNAAIEAGPGESGGRAIRDIADRTFSSPEQLVDFMKARSDASRDIDETTADLLRWIFAHSASAEARAAALDKAADFRDVPEHSPMHAVLLQLESIDAAAAGTEARLDESETARAAAAAVWHLLAKEKDPSASRRLGARLAQAICALDSADRNAMIWQLLSLTGTEAGRESSPAVAGYREALEHFDVGELINSVVAGTAEQADKKAMLKALVEARPETVQTAVDCYCSTADDSAKECLMAAAAAAPTYAVGAAREKAADQDPASLRDLCLLLGAIKHESAVDLLEELSGHDNAVVRRASLSALGENGSPAAALALSRNYDSRDKQTRKSVILLLAGVNQAASLQTLSRIALMRDLMNRRLDERIMAVQALGRFGNEQAQPTLNVVARSKGLLRRRSAAKLRHAADRALARLRGETDTYTVEKRPTD